MMCLPFSAPLTIFEAPKCMQSIVEGGGGTVGTCLLASGSCHGVRQPGSLNRFFCMLSSGSRLNFRDRKGTPKNFCDKDFAELSGELSGAICLKTLVLLGNDR